jgi:carboxypeptidase Q
MKFSLPIFALALASQSSAQSAEVSVVDRIKEEGLNHSKLMPTLSYLTDVIGPRLTGSPSMKRANEWTRDQLASWGLQHAHLEAWGPFGRGWQLDRFSAEVVSPQDIPLIAFPKAWSPSLRGPVTAEVVLVDVNDEAELQKLKGKLKGKIVLNGGERPVSAQFTAQGSRITDKELESMAKPPEPRPRTGDGAPRNNFRAQASLAAARLRFFLEEGAVAVLDGSRGDDGTIFVQSATVPPPAPDPKAKPDPNAAPKRGPSVWDKSEPKTLPQITVSAEQYNRLVRMINFGESLKLTLDLKVQFFKKDLMAYNTVAEIPGSDLKDQVVMVGGHMDSWHSGTGATDNGAGVAVAMEAVRILQALHLPLRRTVRVALWSGEEEGLFGSKAYVADHLGVFSEDKSTGFGGAPYGDRGPLTKKSEYDKVSAYYNLDNGTGKIRGVYLQGNEKVGPIFSEWLAPFKEMGASTVTLRNTGSTDHISFDAVGVPGFQFIQDSIEYGTRTHHSNQDVFDRIQADDLKQAAVIMATFLFNTAQRDELLPRKELGK